MIAAQDAAAGEAPAADAGPAAGGEAVPLRRWREGDWLAEASRPAASPEEAAVAIVIDGASQAVLMATPHELDDFAVGFALTEGLIAGPQDVTGIEVAPVPAPAALPGVPAFEARLWLRPGLAAGLAERRRSMLGPVGCGLCGVDSIAAALPPIVGVSAETCLTPAQVMQAMAQLAEGQRRWRETPAIHAAALWTPGGDTVVREDVGRHNALDKLAGAVARAGLEASRGAVAMTSRLSVDLVQKTARMGASVLIGAGVPTRLAAAWAEAAGMTLVGRARRDSFDIFTHPYRIRDDAPCPTS